MILDGNAARIIFQKVLQLREEMKAYCLSWGARDLPVEEFQRVVSRMYGIDIKKYQVPFEGAFLRGLMERRKGGVVIYVKKNMEEDWKRFISVKEICHAMNDEPEDWASTGVKTIRSLLSEHKFIKSQPGSRVAQSETFAEVAALELLYPFEERKRDYAENGKSDFSTAQLSNIYKIPEVIIAEALTEEYHTFASEAWSLI